MIILYSMNTALLRIYSMFYPLKSYTSCDTISSLQTLPAAHEVGQPLLPGGVRYCACAQFSCQGQRPVAAGCAGRCLGHALRTSGPASSHLSNNRKKRFLFCVKLRPRMV